MENAKCYAPQILVGTEGLPREQWLEYRRKGIGGSDAAAVLGISPFRTGRDLYYDKLNIVTADDAENWVQLEVGTLLEPLVAKIFAHKTGYKIYRRPFMFRHPQYATICKPDHGIRVLKHQMMDVLSLLLIHTIPSFAKSHQKISCHAINSRQLIYLNWWLSPCSIIVLHTDRHNLTCSGAASFNMLANSTEMLTSG